MRHAGSVCSHCTVGAPPRQIALPFLPVFPTGLTATLFVSPAAGLDCATSTWATWDSTARVAQNVRGVVKGVIKGVTKASFGRRAP